MDSVNQWGTFVITVLSFAAGSGWLKYFLERRQAKRTEAQLILDGFLLPLESILDQNRRGHRALTEDSELKNLEYAVDYLQNHFASLPEGDSRKVAWMALIENMLADNDRAVRLIQDNVGKIKSAEFRKACDEFMYHANGWKAMWRATLKNETVSDSLLGPDKLLAPAFPETMESLLVEEISLRRADAGR